MEEKIRTKLEELRGFLQADGGDLEIVSIEGGGCPHATMTIKDGIERILRDEIDPEIVVERA